MENNDRLREALKKYASENGFSQQEIRDAAEKIPYIKQKVSLLTKEEAERIKQGIGKEMQQELEEILGQIK